MTRFRDRYRLESTRLPGWDYTAGWYFVTICTHQGHHFFGKVVNEEVQLSPIGLIVAEEWQRTPQIRPYVTIDAWVIMPNHMHGIIGIDHSTTSNTNIHPTHNVETARRAVSTSPAPFARSSSQLRAGSLGAIIGQFKSMATRRIWASGYRDFAWQTRL